MYTKSDPITQKDPIVLDDCGPIQAILRDGVAHGRLNAFRNSNKFPRLEQVMQAIGKKAVPLYELNLAAFIELMNIFKDGGYNGFRVYFACYPDEPTAAERSLVPPGLEGQLALIFVPTRQHDGYNAGIDDPNKFFVLGAGASDVHPHPLPAPGSVPPADDIVINWISHYRNNRMDAFEVEGGEHTGNTNYKETRSHWYDMKTIAGNPAIGDKGLLAYIECTKTPPATNPIIELYIQFAAFVGTDGPKCPAHRLTLIFFLRRKNDPKPTKDLFLPIAGAVVLGSKTLLDESADTGVPCPPATYCPGSSVSVDN